MSLKKPLLWAVPRAKLDDDEEDDSGATSRGARNDPASESCFADGSRETATIHVLTIQIVMAAIKTFLPSTSEPVLGFVSEPEPALFVVVLFSTPANFTVTLFCNPPADEVGLGFAGSDVVISISDSQ